MHMPWPQPRLPRPGLPLARSEWRRPGKGALVMSALEMVEWKLSALDLDRIAAVLAEADGGCDVCTSHLAEGMKEIIAGYPWRDRMNDFGAQLEREAEHALDAFGRPR